MGKGNGRKRKSGKKSDAKDDVAQARDGLPAVIEPTDDAPRIETRHGSFDLDDPALPAWIERRAFKSGGYPYSDHLDDDDFEKQLTLLQIELVKLQRYVSDKALRLLLLFEGRDAAGKGGAIFAFTQYLNPRMARVVALPRPSETETGQWYFQRYVAHFPTRGESVLFDRSWYNRAGVEPVMGFCTPEQHRIFLKEVPRFEHMLASEGIMLFKFWLEIGRETQLKRFHERRHDPLKIWKLSSIDYAAMTKWNAYTAARDEMLAVTHTAEAPWTAVLANDKRRGRLEIIRHVLSALNYAGKDKKVVGKPDRLIVGGPELIGIK